MIFLTVLFYVLNGFAFDSESLMLPTVKGFAFDSESLMLSSVNGFYPTFKAGCLGYLYLTVDVYNSHFCHLKFYPQNRLYFQNIINERKSILFSLHQALTLPIHMSQMR